MQDTHLTRSRARLWIALLIGCLITMLAAPAVSHAEESNPNNYSCLGSISAGEPEEGSEEQQVKYRFYCDGPITGYQLESQIPLTGVGAAPLVSAIPSEKALTDTFSCAGEFPGYAVNCVGATKGGYETISGQFAIGKKLCVEPREDPLLTVTDAYLEKGAIVQAISGPFDLGRPLGCPPDAYSGSTRLNPRPPVVVHRKSKKHKKTKKQAKKSASAKKATVHRVR